MLNSKGGKRMQDYVNYIGSLGFPIVACFFMWKYINTTLKDFNTTMQENTKILTKLYERLGGGENGEQ